MTPDTNKPDLRQIGQSAFTEVVGTLLRLPATVGNPTAHTALSGAPDQITSGVLLRGPRLSGTVQVQLPLGFVGHAVRVLTGLDGAEEDAKAVQDDVAGEIANMVAGRVAAQLTAEGYACQLGPPSVSRSACLPTSTRAQADHGHTDLICEGHCLSLEIECHYAVP